jgi:hypothetical protein
MAETEVKVVTFGEDVIRTTVKSSGRAVERWITEVLSPCVWLGSHGSGAEPTLVLGTAPTLLMFG